MQNKTQVYQIQYALRSNCRAPSAGLGEIVTDLNKKFLDSINLLKLSAMLKIYFKIVPEFAKIVSKLLIKNIFLRI